MLDFSPHSRDKLSREFWIEKRLLTRSPDAGRGRVANPTSSRGCGTTKGALKGRVGMWEGVKVAWRFR